MIIGTNTVVIIALHDSNYCVMNTYSETKALNFSCIVCVCSHNICSEPWIKTICATYSLTPKPDAKFFFSTL